MPSRAWLVKCVVGLLLIVAGLLLHHPRRVGLSRPSSLDLTIYPHVFRIRAHGFTERSTR